MNSYKKVVSNSWTSHEQEMNKSQTGHVEDLNLFKWSSSSSSSHSTNSKEFRS